MPPLGRAIIANSMNPTHRTRSFPWLVLIGTISLGTPVSRAQTTEPPKYPNFPSETPAQLQAATSSFDHVRREVMIPMRDGVKLHTVILVPRSATPAKQAPILLTRTPYSADELTTHANSAHLGPSLWGYDNATEVIVEGGYIRVVQDVRGKYES